MKKLIVAAIFFSISVALVSAKVGYFLGRETKIMESQPIVSEQTAQGEYYNRILLKDCLSKVATQEAK